MYLQYMPKIHATVSIDLQVKEDALYFVRHNGLSLSELIERLLKVHLAAHAADKKPKRSRK